MAILPLPYLTADSPAGDLAQTNAGASPAFPLLARPPAASLRPAVAIPSVLGLALAATIVWAGSQPASAVPLPRAAASAEPIVAPSVSPALPESVRNWSPEIERWAAEFELPVELVAVVMTIESCGNPAVRSGAGAQGLFQVMPFHFAPGEDASDPEVNARRGLAYLRRSLQLASGDTALALAGYNGGHSLIQRDPHTWPAETSRYVRWGSGILADLGAGIPSSPALQSWLDAGGAHLCRSAGQAQLP